jgi:hypothetical protein
MNWYAGPDTTFPRIFCYSCADLLLLWAEHFYTTWRLRGTLKVISRNTNVKNIYNENWKILAARKKFIVRGSILVTARPRTRTA